MERETKNVSDYHILQVIQCHIIYSRVIHIGMQYIFVLVEDVMRVESYVAVPQRIKYRPIAIHLVTY